VTGLDLEGWQAWCRRAARPGEPGAKDWGVFLALARVAPLPAACALFSAWLDEGRPAAFSVFDSRWLRLGGRTVDAMLEYDSIRSDQAARASSVMVAVDVDRMP